MKMPMRRKIAAPIILDLHTIEVLCGPISGLIKKIERSREFIYYNLNMVTIKTEFDKNGFNVFRAKIHPFVFVMGYGNIDRA
jgi:hypothetical protein